MDRAIVIHPTFPAGRRIIAVSDIHGNLPFFRALMDKISLTPQDILVLVGDILEKGPESLALLRHVMALCRTHTVYPLCGNCDGLVYRFFQGDELDRRFFSFYLPQHPESTLRQLAREGGFDQTEDLPRLRADLRSAYPEEWRFLSRMPTILETEHLVFVHGGVPSLEHMDQLERWRCMKNDDFLGQGHAFDKWVIVGHWPVTLYRPDIQSAAPILLPGRRIASIDGGCVLKKDGQLNALILPEERTAHRHRSGRTAALCRPPEHPLGPQRRGGTGGGGGAVPVPPSGDGADAVHPEPLSAHGPGRPVVRGLHRLPSARGPRGRADPGRPDQNRFFVQKRWGDRVVLWPPVRYNINPSKKRPGRFSSAAPNGQRI